jgi:arylsulfatase A-like enzyme
MKAKKSFLIVFRLVFVFLSLQFLRDAFHKWDGYSYFMRFFDFLPELSISFILWSIMGFIMAAVLWSVIYSLYLVLPKSLIPLRLEHILAYAALILLPVFTKKVFIKQFYLSDLTGLDTFELLILAGIIGMIVVFFLHKYAEKILYFLNNSITPLFWLFIILLIIALPFSVIKKDSSDREPDPNLDNYITLPEENRPNIILVIMDTLTARDMQLYGYERPTTPYISQWSKNAIVFERAYSTSNWTTPSVMSIMTGQRPWTHTIWYRALDNAVHHYEHNVAALLKNNHYVCYSTVQNPHAHPDKLGMQNAFAAKDSPFSFWLPGNWWMEKLANIFINRQIPREWIFDQFLIPKTRSFAPPRYATLTPSEKVYDRSLEIISQKQSRQLQQPFFLWIHTFPPHDFYLPPEPYMGLFGDEEHYNTDIKQIQSGLIYNEYPPEKQVEVNLLRKRYNEFILYSDKQFELFLSRLAETIDLSNTIIILTSDHGESFSHGIQSHTGPHLYESLVHVPLIIKLPGQTEGRVIDMPVEQIDIAPTILELAGIPLPKWIEGRSLVPLIKGMHLEQIPVYAMSLIRNRSFRHPITKGTIAVWEEDYKLIYYLDKNKKLLFHMKMDPEEMENIIDDEPIIGARLMKLIDENLSLANERIIGSHNTSKK